jgi:hypothetical protein
MLRGVGEAHHPRYQRVVAAVGAPACIGEQFIETVGGLLASAAWHVEAECSQSRCGHRDQQRGLALAPRGEVRKPFAHELVTREVVGDVWHVPMVCRTDVGRVPQRAPRRD